MHEKIRKALAKNAKHIHAWWDFTGRPDPGEDGIIESLKRLVSGVLTHPVTIGKCVAQVRGIKESTVEFGGLFLIVTHSLGSLLRMAMRRL